LCMREPNLLHIPFQVPDLMWTLFINVLRLTKQEKGAEEEIPYTLLSLYFKEVNPTKLLENLTFK